MAVTGNLTCASWVRPNKFGIPDRFLESRSISNYSCSVCFSARFHYNVLRKNCAPPNYAARWFSEFRRLAKITSFGQPHNYQPHNYEKGFGENFWARRLAMDTTKSPVSWPNQFWEPVGSKSTVLINHIITNDIIT